MGFLERIITRTSKKIMIMTETIKARLIKKREEVPKVTTFCFSPEERIDFNPGQFAFFNFEFEGKNYTKHFTISSSPKKEKIEMTTIISGSDYKQALSNLPLGHTVEISRPLGKFTLDVRKSDKVAFLVGGIGITPVKSILENLDETKKSPGLEITVFHSCRNQSLLLFKEELGELAKKVGKTKIVHTLTDERVGGWSGETGFIDKRMIKKHLNDEQNTTFFIAGPPAFNEAMEKILVKELGVKKEMVVSEGFSGY